MSTQCYLLSYLCGPKFDADDGEFELPTQNHNYIHSVYCAIYAVYIYAVVILMSVFAFKPITEGTDKWNVYLNNFRHVSGHAYR